MQWETPVDTEQMYSWVEILEVLGQVYNRLTYIAADHITYTAVQRRKFDRAADKVVAAIEVLGEGA